MIAPTLFRAKIPARHGWLRTPRTCHVEWKFGAAFQGLTGLDGSPVGPEQHLTFRHSCR
jgi:hypothetical protein